MNKSSIMVLAVAVLGVVGTSVYITYEAFSAFGTTALTVAVSAFGAGICVGGVSAVLRRDQVWRRGKSPYGP